MNPLTVIISTYNRASLWPRLFAAYEQQETIEPFEMIVVDDASTDDTLQVLQAYRPRHFTLRVLHQEANLGQGLARNRAISQVQTPLILIAGDDMFPTPALLQGHLEAHQRWPDRQVAILGRVTWPAGMEVNTLMSHIDGVGAQQFPFYYLKDGAWCGFEHFYTSNISLKTDFLRSLDVWFSPAFRIYGFEDIELGYRLARRGMRIRYQYHLIVEHYHHHTIHSFVLRQMNAGRMAHTLFTLHPGLRFKFPRPTLCQIVYWLASASVQANPKEVQSWQVAVCAGLSTYETNPVPGLDDLYRQTLEYFYYQGFLDEALQHSPRRLAAENALARHKLLPVLNFLNRRS